MKNLKKTSRICGGTMKVKIEKVFVVNLDDRVHRWNLFKNLKDSNIERISASTHEKTGLSIVNMV